MVQVTKALLICCLNILHSTRTKMILSLDSSYHNSWKSLAFSNSYYILPIFKNCSSLIKIIIFVGFMILSKIM